MSVDTCIEELPNKYHPDQCDLCEGGRSQSSIDINGISPEKPYSFEATGHWRLISDM